MDLITSDAELTHPNQTTYLSLAIALHAALFIWNPTLFRDAWKTVTALGEGTVLVVDVPGPASSEHPGVRIPTAVPSAALTPLGSYPPATRPSMTIPLHVNMPPPLVSKSFHPMRAPDLPMEIERGVGVAPITVPIPIERGLTSPLPIKSQPVLTEHRTGLPAFHELGGGMDGIDVIAGDGGAGRVRIQFIEPVERVAEPLKAPLEPSRAKTVNGPSIEGPLSNRAVLQRVIPPYPAWAEEQGIMGAVRLYFTVTAQGHVRSMIRVERTSGSPELDRLAVDALRQWRFSPMGEDDGQQWGTITFSFSLGQD